MHQITDNANLKTKNHHQMLVATDNMKTKKQVSNGYKVLIGNAILRKIQPLHNEWQHPQTGALESG